jgi:hypothetical protein
VEAGADGMTTRPSVHRPEVNVTWDSLNLCGYECEHRCVRGGRRQRQVEQVELERRSHSLQALHKSHTPGLLVKPHRPLP